MLKTRIIPCLDVKNGRTVKGVNFVNLTDAGDPVALARAYSEQGADELCFLDITASYENRRTIFDVVTQTAEQCFMPLTVGGGVRSAEDMVKLLSVGADKVAINTAAVYDPEIISSCAKKVGSQCVVVAIDARIKGTERWEVFTHGGRKIADVDLIKYATQVESLGAGEILLTSMDRDGTKKGFDLPMIRAVCDAVNIPVIASGGAGCAEDFAPAIIEGGASAVLAASVFHFGEVTLEDVRNSLQNSNVAIRPIQRGQS